MKGISKTAASIKCYYRMNPYGERDKIINNGNKSLECPRYSQTEDWRYLVQYNKTEEFKKDFIIDMYQELKQHQHKEITNQELRIIINNIRRYINKEDEDHKTN